MRRYFHAEWPDMFGLADGNIEVGGLEELRSVLKTNEWVREAHIDKQRHFDPVWGEYYHVMANDGTIVGIVNFYEE